jgi:hypothetical protein
VVASAHGVCTRCGLPPPAPVVTGPRDEGAHGVIRVDLASDSRGDRSDREIWRKVAGPERPGGAYFAIVALASLALGALLAAWALGLL